MEGGGNEWEGLGSFGLGRAFDAGRQDAGQGGQDARAPPERFNKGARKKLIVYQSSINTSGVQEKRSSYSIRRSALGGGVLD
jgi:hypothetical protein